MGRADSLFSYYKALIALRKSPEYAETIVYGALEPYMEDTKNLMAFYRKGNGQTLLVAGNFSKEPCTLPLPSPCKKVLLDNTKPVSFDAEPDYDTYVTNSEITIQGAQALILELEA